MCQLDVIRECKKIKLLRRALKTLPKTLDETYERVLSSIPDDYAEDVRRVLQCLICAFVPLDIQEVAEIVAIDTAEPYYHPEDRYSTPRALLSICSGLVSTEWRWRYGILPTAEFEFEELRLAHFSVKEYLVSGRISLGPVSKYESDEVSCHETLADLCVSYLLQYEEDVYDSQSVTTDSNFEAQESGDEQPEIETVSNFQEDLDLCERSPFAPYAAMFWSRHLRAARLDDAAPLYAKSMKLIANPALLDRIVRYHRNWVEPRNRRILRDLGIATDSLGIHSSRKPLDTPVSPVYYASLLGLDSFVSQLLEAGESANSVGPSGTALAMAALYGHKRTVQLLIKMGANVNGQEVWKKTEDGTTILSRTALHAAIEKSHEDIIHVLLDHGAAVNTRLAVDGYAGFEETNTPLQGAVLRGSFYLVRNLLDRGADATVAGGYMGDALDIACGTREDVDLARLLLEKIADLISPQRLADILQSQITWNNESLQKLLVEYGADVALVDFDWIRSHRVEHYGESESEAKDYIVRTKAILAQIEKRSKRSVTTPDSVE